MFITKLMERIPFFARFTADELRQLAETDSFIANYPNGDYLVREGGNDSTLFILVRGAVEVTREDAPEVALATLEEGSVFGEISFLTHRPRTANVIARDDVTAFILESHSLERLDPVIQLKIKDQLIAILVQRLEGMNNALLRAME